MQTSCMAEAERNIFIKCKNGTKRAFGNRCDQKLAISISFSKSKESTLDAVFEVSLMVEVVKQQGVCSCLLTIGRSTHKTSAQNL